LSALYCWIGCDRLAQAAEQLGLRDRRNYWSKASKTIAEVQNSEFKELIHIQLVCF